MGGKSSAPSPPDYGPLIQANEKTSKFAMRLAQEQWDWARRVYDENKGLMKDTNESFLKTMEDARIASEEDRARYKSIYQPQEDRLVHDLQTYDTPERRDKEVGAAQANVAQQFDAARDQNVAQLESYGVNPSATRFASLDIGIRGAEAASKAAAGTNAATAVEDKARSLRTAAIDIGKGYPGSYTAAGQLGVTAGGQAQTGTNQAYQTGAQAMGTGPQWLGGSNEALGNWGTALNQQYSNQLGQFNANQSASSGWGSALGMIGGIAMKRFGFAEGGAVPEEVSPSGGGRQDDVPVAVSVGEFIVPKETVSWFGEKHFYKLNEKAQQEKVEAKAVPTESQPVVGGVPGRVGMARGGMVDGGGWATTPGFPDNPIARSPGYPDNPIARSPGFPDVARPISYRPPPYIPHYGPDPGRGVGLPRGYPIPQHPYPAPDLGRGISMRPPPPIPHYGPDPGRGISMRPPPPIPHYRPAPLSIPYGPDAVSPISPSIPYGPDALPPPMRMRF
jgi:hypothetical protein